MKVPFRKCQHQTDVADGLPELSALNTEINPFGSGGQIWSTVAATGLRV